MAATAGQGRTPTYGRTGPTEDANAGVLRDELKFLRGRATGEHWRAFVAELARAEHGLDAGAREEACAAACALFEAYAAAFVEHRVIAP